jgi:hypothetical protein
VLVGGLLALVLVLAAMPEARAHGYLSRPWRSGREVPLEPFHVKGGFYFDYGVGFSGLLQPTGAYRFLQPTLAFRAALGWHLSPLLGVELGYTGQAFKVRPGAFGDIPEALMSAVSLDLRFRFVKPTTRRIWIPYLATGVGVNILSGTPELVSDCGVKTPGESRSLAFGGSLRAGFGVDAYLVKGILRVGARALYTHAFMGAVACDPGTPCGRAGNEPLNRVSGVQLDLTFGAQLPW